MTSDAIKRGTDELRMFRRQSRALYWVVALFSLFANLLLLTGPLFMLQVYDRVLGSGSRETLVALSLLVVFSYAVMGVLDGARGRIISRIAARFQVAAEGRVFDAVLRQSVQNRDVQSANGLADLEAVRRMIASPVVTAAFDLPWTPIFFAAIFIFHPMLGLLSVAGALSLIAITIGNQMLSRRSQVQADVSSIQADGIATQVSSDAEIVQALSMQAAVFERWKIARGLSLSHQMHVSDVGGGFSALSRTLRMMLQSAMLGLGAWLVLANQMTPGGMIAGSILLGRALAPVELLLAQWPVAQRGRQAWVALAGLLGHVPIAPVHTLLPMPKAILQASGVTVVPPGERRAVLRGLSFKLGPGQALGVIGPSGAGKSTLARVLTGAWPLGGGCLRLDGAGLAQYGPEVLGQYIGYLPQRLQLFDGTIAQNIARLAEDPDDAKVIAAAKLAAAHEMILELPNGYDTLVQGSATRLSGGQIQRIGLARALYHDPVLVVLDEPNSNLDNAGSAALNHAIRHLKAGGKSVLIMAHRPAAIQECDLLLVLDAGRQAAFGPKQEVMASMVKNAEAIRLTPVQSAGAA